MPTALKKRKVGRVEVGLRKNDATWTVYRWETTTARYLSTDEVLSRFAAESLFATTLIEEENSAQNSAFLDAELFKKTRPAVAPGHYSSNPYYGRF